MATLKTNYKDDVLNTSVNTNRKFVMSDNGDYTVSFRDVTDYTQTGDNFGAADINATNIEVNGINTNLAGFKFRNNNGQAQYSKDGGTTWTNFKNPVGTKSITANGTYDVTDYASVNVSVNSISGATYTRTGVEGSPVSSSMSITGGAGTYIIAFAAANDLGGTINCYVDNVSTSNGTITEIVNLSHVTTPANIRLCMYKLVTSGNATVYFTARYAAVGGAVKIF